MGCQNLLESVPGRSRVSSLASRTFSEGKSLKLKSSGRSVNGRTSKSEDLSCRSSSPSARAGLVLVLFVISPLLFQLKSEPC